ncbi:MAG: Gfo/Idh/MocA family oxidoreductase [Alphaproteobacteria bacterium]|nr:Gfo/Idh/MocA family oxidoreductase [Alphaproteobacteria bacterium]MBQ9234854.1 Gfo/Idh/MocA family oxidoreductase [Alphaproteobacteria bacterium]
MTNPIKVAVIGAGMMGKNHLRTYKSLPEFELVGVYDIFHEAAQNAAAMFGIKAFASLEEAASCVDAVSVVTTSVTHAEVGEFFLQRGIHCLIEKPLAATEAECKRLIAAAKDNNAVLLVGHIEQFNPAVEQLHKILADNSQICALSANRMSAASGRITDVDVAMDLMIHDAEVILSLVKSPVVNVSAAAVRNAKSPSGKDYITALVEFANGATASMTASRITSSRVRTLSVTTNDNYIDMDYIAQSVAVCSQGRMHNVAADTLSENMRYGLKGSAEYLFVPQTQPLAAELSHFGACLRGQATPRISGEQALEALKLIWQVQHCLSARTTAAAAAE